MRDVRRIVSIDRISKLLALFVCAFYFVLLVKGNKDCLIRKSCDMEHDYDVVDITQRIIVTGLNRPIDLQPYLNGGNLTIVIRDLDNVSPFHSTDNDGNCVCFYVNNTKLMKSFKEMRRDILKTPRWLDLGVFDTRFQYFFQVTRLLDQNEETRKPFLRKVLRAIRKYTTGYSNFTFKQLNDDITMTYNVSMDLGIIP